MGEDDESRPIPLPRKSPRAEELYSYLRAAILRGELEPNERLVEQAIAERASVSRTPVREALHRLEVDGLVRNSSRGVAVVDFSDDELYELCVARECMEGIAARLAATARTEFALAAFDRILEETRAAIGAGDVARLVDLNHAFHETVWQAARNRYLANELMLLRSLIERLQATTLSVEARQIEALHEHQRLVRALGNGDSADAEAITRRHFQTAMAIRLSRARTHGRIGVTPDVVVVGGGNAGLCAAIAARLAGARVLLLERADRAVRGGNSKFVRNVRCASEGRGGYGLPEFEADLAAVGGDASVSALGRMVIRESRDLVPWMEAQGVRWQAAMRGTIGLRRTNRFFLGGGKALLNRYYRRAEELGVEVRYGVCAERIALVDGRFREVVASGPDGEVTIPATAAIVASGGFQANLEWLARYWGAGVQNYRVRGAATNDGRVLASLLDAGIASEGNPRGFHAVAVDARAPRFDGGIVTRIDAIPCGIVVDRDARRFHDEGQDVWPKRYASWGKLIAERRDQIAFAVCDSRAHGTFIPPAFAPYTADSIPELAVQLDLDAGRLAHTVREFNAATAAAGGRYDTSRLDGIGTTGLVPAKSNWALPIDAPPFYGYPMRTGVTFTYLGVRVDGGARAITTSGEVVDNLFAAGEVMAGNILHEGYLAGFGMTIGSVMGRLAGTGAARIARR